ncbi:MAG: hypothetical protein HQK51_15330 [Oligoflexia bacterium]|nr:hypothetical protein [Oligoflexia bacterium]
MKNIEQDTSILTNQLLKKLLTYQESPCLSIYLTTHRHFPDNQPDTILFGNLVKKLEASLHQNYSKNEVSRFLKPFKELSNDTDFWSHTLDGLAVFGAPDFFQTLRLSWPITELVTVGDSFHVKPLWRYLQSVDRYQILGLSRDKIRFFEGNRHRLTELELVQGVPQSIEDALGSELSEPHQTVASYGGVGGESTSMHHGHGGKKDEVKKDTEKFFRAVDRAVLEHFSQPTSLPLILAALPEHHHLFRQLSKNPHLISSGINYNPNSLSIEKLREVAWETIEPLYHSRLVSLKQEFEQARAKGFGSDDLGQVIEAAKLGRVETLLIKNKIIDPNADDELDNLGELVAKMGGQVFVLPEESMPTDTDLAAKFRY